MRTYVHRATLGVILLVALGFAGAAQDCSVRSYSDGLCFAELVLAMRLGGDYRVAASEMSVLVALATLPGEPLRVSLVSTPPAPHRALLSYHTTAHARSLIRKSF
jgi:hypothetical protein